MICSRCNVEVHPYQELDMGGKLLNHCPLCQSPMDALIVAPKRIATVSTDLVSQARAQLSVSEMRRSFVV
jgi:hypothetical protein